jgi:hypothetical protein
MVFFLLSAMLLVFTISSAWGDQPDEAGVGGGSTAGVIEVGRKQYGAADTGSGGGGQGQGNDTPQRLPDPLDDGFDLPL